LSGNLVADPLFVNANSADFRLQAGSACIDAGIQDTTIVYNNNQDTMVVLAMDYLGQAPEMGAVEFDPSATWITSTSEIILEKFSLFQNYPNPFNSTTAICYQISAFRQVELSIYNLRGQKVASLVSERQPAGYYTIVWDASNFPNGVYFCRLEAGDYKKVIKLALVK
jgi:hypothetical protein